MRWIQLTVPHPMAALLRDAAKVGRRAGKFSSEDDKALGDVIDFLDYADEHPNAFPPTGTMASSIKTRARRVDGVRRNDGTLQDGTPREHTKRAHRPTKRPTRHARRLQETRDRKERNRAERLPIHHHVEGHGQQPPAERKGLLARLGLGRPQAQDPHADV